MKKKCEQCGFDFNETSIQYHNRTKKNLPVHCRDCNRINQAEERAEKRKVEKDDSKLGQALRWIKKYGDISEAFIMNKFKFDFNEAKMLVQEARRAHFDQISNRLKK